MRARPPAEPTLAKGITPFGRCQDGPRTPTVRPGTRRSAPQEVRPWRSSSAARTAATGLRSSRSSRLSRASTATASCSSPRRTTSCREHGMPPVDAMRLIGEELVLDGIPQRNLATFVTTWMEPEAQRVIAENLHRNFIDHAEYPQTAEIEQRCIRMLADLFHAPGETTGARTQGSSEAIMLGALSLKWKWRERREQAGKDTAAPEPHLRRRRARRVGEVLPLLRRRAAHHPAAARQVHDRPRGRRAATSTRTRSASPRCSGRRSRATPTTSAGSTTCSSGSATSRDSTSRSTWTRRAAASCGRSCTPTRRGTSGSSRCARSTSRATSSGSSTRASAGSCSASRATSPRTSSSTRTTSASATRRSR